MGLQSILPLKRNGRFEIGSGNNSTKRVNKTLCICLSEIPHFYS
jgi:hypothetical protein